MNFPNAFLSVALVFAVGPVRAAPSVPAPGDLPPGAPLAGTSWCGQNKTALAGVTRDQALRTVPPTLRFNDDFRIEAKQKCSNEDFYDSNFGSTRVETHCQVCLTSQPVNTEQPIVFKGDHVLSDFDLKLAGGETDPVNAPIRVRGFSATIKTKKNGEYKWSCTTSMKYADLMCGQTDFGFAFPNLPSLQAAPKALKLNAPTRGRQQP